MRNEIKERLLRLERHAPPAGMTHEDFGEFARRFDALLRQPGVDLSAVPPGSEVSTVARIIEEIANARDGDELLLAVVRVLDEAAERPEDV